MSEISVVCEKHSSFRGFINARQKKCRDYLYV